MKPVNPSTVDGLLRIRLFAYILPLALTAQSVPRLNILRFIGVDFSECRSLSCPQTSYCAYLVRVIPVAPRANFFTGCFILADNLPQPRRFYSKYLRGFSCRNKVRMRIVFAFFECGGFLRRFCAMLSARRVFPRVIR